MLDINPSTVMQPHTKNVFE
jgi:hypothetical protein